MSCRTYLYRYLAWIWRVISTFLLRLRRLHLNQSTILFASCALFIILYTEDDPRPDYPRDSKGRRIYELIYKKKPDTVQTIETNMKLSKNEPFRDHENNIVKYEKPTKRSTTTLDYILDIDSNELIERNLDKTESSLRRRLPQVLTIGFAKCGTAALHFLLELNPALAPSKCESNFLAIYERYVQGYNAYRSLMQPSTPDQVTLDRGTFYAVVPEIMPRINATNKNMKFILVACDPITRDISQFTHWLNTSKRPQNASSPDPSFRNFFFEKGVLKPEMMRYKYDELILPWLTYLKQKRMHIVDGTRFKTHPVEEMQLVEDFLGVKRAISYKDLVFNKEKGFFCKFVETMDICMDSQKGRLHPKVTNRLKGKLKAFYKPHVKKFSELTGRQFAWSAFHMNTRNS